MILSNSCLKFYNYNIIIGPIGPWVISIGPQIQGPSPRTHSAVYQLVGVLGNMAGRID
jgi:hypothetical protein